jgi:co-chaperonin GroES (HSP10)
MWTRLSLLFLIISYQARGQWNSEDIIRENKIKLQKVFEGKVLVASEQFNDKGLTLYSYVNNFLVSGLIITTTYIFENDRESKRLMTHSSFPGDTTIFIFKYDNHKRLSQRIYQGTAKSYTNYEYDSMDREIKEAELDSTKTQKGLRTFVYNKKGQVIEEVSQGKNVILSKTSYDDRDREKKFQVFKGDKIIFDRAYAYNNQDLIIDKYDSIDNRGIKFIYNKSGQLKTRLHYKTENKTTIIIGTETFKYSRNGLIKEFTKDIFNGRGIKRKYRYTYE